MPVSGHIHILVVFAEVVYDTGQDPCSPEGSKDWPSGSLPKWKDKLFDTYPSHNPKGIITKFFYESSFGNYIVTGDYLVNKKNPDAPVKILASEKITTEKILIKASEFKEFTTRNNFIINDFDKWTLSHVGHPKHTPSTDAPLLVDHVMIIIRNSTYPYNSSGWTSSRSPGRIFGYE
ncbi:MAG: hypothetical protein QMD11_12950, partial [Smithella sp.]|nr:hypothetical protein [Smithella sp.]